MCSVFHFAIRTTVVVTVIVATTAAYAQIPSYGTLNHNGHELTHRLETTDIELSNGRFMKCFDAHVSLWDVFTVTMRSADFDTLLMAYPGGCEAAIGDNEIEMNDDFESRSTDSQISLRAIHVYYAIIATSYSGGSTGNFTLTLSFPKGVHPASSDAQQRSRIPDVVPLPPPEVQEVYYHHVSPIPSDPFNAEIISKMIHDQVNQIRAQHNLPLLVWDETLALGASNHSADMSRRNYFSHQNPDGLAPTDRFNRMGFQCRFRAGAPQWIGVAENIHMGYTWSSQTGSRYTFRTTQQIVDMIVDGWMNSSGHRENILGDYSRMGIGVATGSNHRIYATQVFC